jgi:hypothetical protein
LASDFSAVASMLGYSYQFRYALVEALERLRTGLSWSVSIETADDVVFDGPGAGELHQLKHRSSGSLSDLSVDVWKSLRVWSESVADGRIDPQRDSCYLVSTSSAPDGSAAALLRPGTVARDPRRAAALLRAAKAASSNAELKTSFAAFDSLGSQGQETLLSSVYVLDGSATVSELDERLAGLAVLGVRREHVAAYLERLEGWWFRACLMSLVDDDQRHLSAEQLESRVVSFREMFTADNLPIDDDIAARRPVFNEFGGRTFVQQLELLGISERRLAIAARDYIRAYAQRSRWVREGLLLTGELARYEDRLVDEWERLFAAMEDDLGAAATEEEKVDAAAALYRWAESEADYPIRRNVDEPFVTRGSYHILADEVRVGWHADFQERLAELLEAAG